MDREPRFHGEVSEERHKIMSMIRGKDTKPEIILRKYLWSKGLRYRKNYKGLPGKPDIALTKYKLKEQGQSFIPADITFRRYAKWFKDNNYDKWILARDGEKALSDKVEPYIERDISRIEVGDILVADGHVLNFQVINFHNSQK